MQLNDNGAWSWFMDPRVIVNDGKLIVGSVRAVGSNQANITDPRWGNVEISVYDLATAKVENIVLHPHLEQDDHDGPAFLVRKDGRYLAVYSKHTKERRMYYRISEPHNPLVWGPAMIAETPGDDAPVQGNNCTYANLFRMPNGRIYNFIRAFHHDPNYMYSDDEGSTWTYGGHWLYGKGGYSPYLKYADDGKGTIHFIATEDHPRNFDNSLYHGYVRDGVMYKTDGTRVNALSTSTEATNATWDFTKVYQGTPDSVAWMVDVELDASDRPYMLFSTQVRRPRPAARPGRHGSALSLRAARGRRLAPRGDRLRRQASLCERGRLLRARRARSEQPERPLHFNRRRSGDGHAARQQPPTANGITNCFAANAAPTASGRSRRSRATRRSTICAR